VYPCFKCKKPLHIRMKISNPPLYPKKMKSLVLRIRKRYFKFIISGDKKVEYRKHSQFWEKRIKDAAIAVFICGKQVHRRRIISIQLIDTPKRFSAQGQKDVNTPKCYAINLGEVFNAFE